MDVVLAVADEYLLDTVYGAIPYYKELPRDAALRQLTSLYIITYIFAHVLYFVFASLSYYFLYDKEQMKHPKFLKNQIHKEITLSIQGFPLTTLVTIPWFFGEIRGHSLLYDDVSDYGWVYLAFSALFFLFFTDMAIYWIHRWLHTPWAYVKLHKPHHRWIVPTPFASHAFHPLDGYLQSVPYHLFVYLFPMNKYLYLASFVFVNFWTISIHDGEYMTNHPFVNGAAHHTYHHLYFNFNYGQYFTLWDRIGKTHRDPDPKLFEKEYRTSQEHYISTAKEVEAMLEEDFLRDDSVEYLVKKVSSSASQPTRRAGHQSSTLNNINALQL